MAATHHRRQRQRQRQRRLTFLTLASTILLLSLPGSSHASWWSSDSPANDEVTVEAAAAVGEDGGKEQVVEASISSDGTVDVQADCAAADVGETSTCSGDASKANSGSDSDTDEEADDAEAEAEPLPWGQTHIDWPQLPVVFHNDGDTPVEIHYQTAAGQDDMHFGEVPAHDTRNFNTYHGSAWYVTEPGQTAKLQTLFVADDDGKTDYHFDSKEERDRKNAERTESEREFRQKYKEENGTPWIAQYPRDPPIYHMYKANEVGDITTVKSNSPKWTKDGPLPDVSIEELPEDEKLEFRVETLSLTPKVFAIHDVLSKDECDFMVDRAQLPGRLKRSLVTTSAVVSKVRTSSNAWFPVEESPIIENIFNRIADVLQMPRYRLRHNQCAENIQLVHYNTTQEYQKHHDYLDPRTFRESVNVQRGNNRFATILFYLNDIEEGGHTFFPRSEQGKDFKARLPVGSAVLFYSMLEDGNLDVLSEHGGAPVTKGEKYVANLWVWEPRWI